MDNSSQEYEILKTLINDQNLKTKIQQLREELDQKLQEKNEKEEKELFITFNYVFDGTHYVLPKHMYKYFGNTFGNLKITESEMRSMENRVKNWFSNLESFAYYIIKSYYRGVELNLHQNKNLYSHLEELAFQGNMYVLDFLLFDTLKRVIYEKEGEPYREKALLLYSMIEEPEVIPYNKIYRAVLFDEFDELLATKDPNLCRIWYEWNFDPKILLGYYKSITPEDFNYRGHTTKAAMVCWFIENSK